MSEITYNKMLGVLKLQHQRKSIIKIVHFDTKIQLVGSALF